MMNMMPEDDNQDQGEFRAMPSPAAARHSVSMYRRIVTAFLLLTALVVALVAYVVLSRATVVVLSKQEEIRADFVVDVASAPTGGEVPGLVLQAEDSATRTFPSSSVVSIDAPAEGKVRIVSTFYRPQTLVATTRLLSSGGVLFRLRGTVVIPPNGTVTADVFADQPGASGAVGSTTFTIPGLNEDTRRFFSVETAAPIEGGVKEQRMVTKGDVDAAAALMETELKSGIQAELRAKATAAGLSAPGESVAYEILRRVTDVPVGDESGEFSVTLGLKATAVFYDAAAFDAKVRSSVQDQLPYGRALLSLEDGSTSVSVEKTDMVASRANLRVGVKGTTVLSPDSPALRTDKLLGVTVDAAKKYLERIDGVSSASVQVKPFWIGRLPNVPEHISIEVR